LTVSGSRGKQDDLLVAFLKTLTDGYSAKKQSDTCVLQDQAFPADLFGLEVFLEDHSAAANENSAE
jgi:hypothetical protein